MHFHRSALTVGCYRSRLQMETGHYWSSGVYHGLHSTGLGTRLQSSTHFCPCIQWLHGHSTGPPHTWTGSQGARGSWVLHPKHTQLSPHSPHCSRRGSPCPSAPHPENNTLKPQPQEMLSPLWVPAGAVPVRSMVAKADMAPPPFSHTGCAELTPKPLNCFVNTYQEPPAEDWKQSLSQVYQSPKHNLSVFWHWNTILGSANQESTCVHQPRVSDALRNV